MMTTHTKPLVSVAIPAYNAGAWLMPAVQSILNQSYRNLEIVLVDDGSNDQSIEGLSHIKDSRLRIYRQENAGKPTALNRAIGLMRGEYMALQDADDLSFPTRIEKQVEAMESNRELGFIFTGYDFVIEDRHLAPSFSPLGIDECRKLVVGFKMPGHDPTAMIRTEVFKEFRYNPDFPVVEGLEFILRTGENWSMARLGDCLYSYRISFTSVTRKNVARRIRLVRSVMREAHQRRGLPLPEELDLCMDDAATQNLSNSDSDNNIAAHFMDSVIDLKKAGRFVDALKTALYCSSIHPLDPHYQKALIYSLLPLSLVARIRSRRE